MSEPSPSPTPTPSPTPAPTPNPSPAPSPQPAPSPTPSPSPQPTPTPNVPPVAGNWPDNWRELMAGDDEKALESLKRYSSPVESDRARREAQKRVSQGFQRPKLVENATAEQLAEYRKEIGVPEAADKYDVALGDGHVWGEADKPILDSFTKAAHESNVPNEYIKPILGWYDKLQQANAARQQEADAGFKKENLDVLAGEWGGTLGMEARIADELWQGMGEDLYARFSKARDASGRLLFADAALIKWANRMQREINPAATVVPGSGTNSMQAMETEIAGLKKLMGDATSEYWKGPNAAKNQARYRELIDAQSKVGKRQ